jgi:hypothetical protein
MQKALLGLLQLVLNVLQLDRLSLGFVNNLYFIQGYYY